MSLRRKSLHRSRNQKHAKKRANQRAAKERHRIARALADPVLPDCSHVVTAKAKPSGFRITIECLDDGERASFTTARGPFGLMVSATECGRRIASVITHYQPAAAL
jgi:hypothetical protein